MRRFLRLSAVDVAVWDLKARLLNLPLVTLLGSVHDAVPVYGSGGFITYDEARLCRQLSGWIEEGIPRVKMKIGRNVADDLRRIASVRRMIEGHAELFVGSIEEGYGDLMLSSLQSVSIFHCGGGIEAKTAGTKTEESENGLILKNDPPCSSITNATST